MTSDTRANEDRELLLNLIEEIATKEPVSHLLREHGLAYSGTWEDFRKRLNRAMSEETIPYQKLAEFLHKRESYGNQHVFLFKIDSHVLDPLRNAEYVKSILKKQPNISLELNTYNVLHLPEEPEIASVEHSEAKMTVKWVEKRTSERLVETVENDADDAEYALIRYYERITTRMVNVLQVDFERNIIDLRISQLPNKRNYSAELAAYLHRCMPFLDVRLDGTEIKLGKVIKACLESPETRTRRVELRSPDRSQARYASAGQDGNVREASVYKQMDANFRNLCDGLKARVYWSDPAGDMIAEGDEVSTIIYELNEIAFTTSASMDEVEHVLRRVRELAE